MTDNSAALARARRAFLWRGIALPLVLTAVAVGVQVEALPSLPDPVAIHWNAAGEADGFAPPWVVPLFSAGFGILLTALLGVFALLGTREGEWGPTMRFLGTMTPAVVGAILVLTTWATLAQRGLVTGEAAPGVLPALLAGGVAGVVLGVLAWFLQPAVTVSGGTVAVADDGHVPTFAPGERVVWMRSVTMSRLGMVILLGLGILLLGGAVFDALAGGSAWPILLSVALVVGLAITATGLFRVRVDDSGVRVISYLGVPRFHVPLTEIAAVRASRVHPLAACGGWGVRTALDGRTGVVLRRGEALEIAKRSGRVFVVTVDDAATAAAAIEGLRAREEAKN